MKKSDIKKTLNITSLMQQAKNKDVNAELEDLARIENVLEDLGRKVNLRIQALTKDLNFCPYCKKYFHLDPARCYWNERVEQRIAYWDSGYGDDDRYVDSKVYYKKIDCPFCGKSQTVDKMIGDDIPGTERDKYGKVYN